MNLKDVSYFCICDSNKTIFYEMNFDGIDSKDLLSCEEDISIYKEHSLFVSTKTTPDSINYKIILLAVVNSNDSFVYNAFSNFVDSVDKIIKNWSARRIEQKFDQIVFLANEFLYNGIILVDDASVLSNRLQNRTFENAGGMKVNKGFASFLGKAAKSIKNGIRK